MKKVTTFCDRCGNEILCGEEAVLDLSISLAATLLKEDLLLQQQPGTALKKMIEMYHHPHTPKSNNG